MNKRQQRLHEKRLAYLQTFCGEDGKPHAAARIVLRDLKRFCRVGINQSGLVISPVSRVVDSHATVYAVGLRDTFTRITGFINLDETDIEEEKPSESEDTSSSSASGTG